MKLSFAATLLALLLLCLSSTKADCVDNPIGWYDRDGPFYDCDWYALSNYCAWYGNYFADSNGITANIACCVCGGGVESGGPSTTPAPTPAPTPSPTPAPTPNPTPAPTPAPGPTQLICVDDPSGWYDSDGPTFNCAWYSQGTRCTQYGNGYARNGITANMACCVCGGGSLVPPPPTPAPLPIDSNGFTPSCYQPFSTNGFNMCLHLKDTQASGYQPWMDAFGAAKAKWESVIIADVPTATGGFGSSPCGQIPTSIDDMYLCGVTEPIDGPYNILGSAGPSYTRQVGGKVMTVTGQMRFDSADVNRYLDPNQPGTIDQWVATIIHEAGHVIGIGTLWELNNLYTSGSEFYEQGTVAQQNWNLLGCSGRLPVELDGGPGTAGGHFDDECLTTEVMTGFLSASSVFSNITVGALVDLGYTVDFTQAETFTTSDLGNCKASYCPEAGTRRRLGGSRHLGGNGQGNGGSNNANKKAKKPISTNGLTNMKKYAAKQMQSLRKAAHKVPEGFEFVGGDILAVMYEEEGEGYAYTFKWNDVKDFAPGQDPNFVPPGQAKKNKNDPLD